MGANLVAINALVNIVLLPLILVAVFKRGWKHAKYLWLVISILGTASLAMHLYLGADVTQYVLSFVFVAFALWNTHSYFKGMKRV